MPSKVSAVKIFGNTEVTLTQYRYPYQSQKYKLLSTGGLLWVTVTFGQYGNNHIDGQITLHVIYTTTKAEM